MNEGRPDAACWLIGRDYGAAEAQVNRPFQGLAGHRLNGALKEAGLDRARCYVDNVVRVQPPGNRWENHTDQDVTAGYQRLANDIKRYQPKLVVAMGQQAWMTAMGYHPDAVPYDLPKITDARGFLWDSPLGVRVLSVTHPSFAERQWTPWMKLFFQDMQKAKRELDLGCPALPQRVVRIVREPAQLQEVRQEMEASRLVAIDVENARNFSLKCLGIATTGGAWVIPAGLPWQDTAIKEVCEGPVAKVLQNGQYDRYLLRRYHGIDVANVSGDTMLQWHTLQPELAGGSSDGKRRHTRKSLAFLVSLFLRDPWWKDYDTDLEGMMELCGKDCCVTLDLHRILEAELAA